MKYINADEFIIPKGAVDDIAKRGVIAIHDLLEIQPSADVAEVVRCKDCLHYGAMSRDSGSCFKWQIHQLATGYCECGIRRKERQMSNYKNAKDLEFEVSHYLQCEKESETITLEELKEIINRLPPADVVEVVRCKDCKNSESVPKEWKDFELACMLRREYTTPDDYCSQAERKETE